MQGVGRATRLVREAERLRSFSGRELLLTCNPNRLQGNLAVTFCVHHRAGDAKTSFEEAETGAADKAFIVGADGSGLQQLPRLGDIVQTSVWSPDQKSVYVSGRGKAGSTRTIWKWIVDGSNAEKFVDNCAVASDTEPPGQYMLGVEYIGEKTGIYEVSTSDRKCISLLPGVVTFGAIFARDGKSFLYAVTSRGEVTVYRQPWKDGKTIGAPQVALKVPFAFPLVYGGNAYDFSRDLSTIVYARPGGQADLYLLSQK
jgi:hypothetical protein